QQEYRPVVVCPEGGSMAAELARRGIETKFAPMPPWRKLFAYPKRAASIRALHAVIAAARPSLIHVNDIWWVPQTLRAASGLPPVPIAAHVRQEIEPSKVRRYGLDGVDLVFAVSRQVQRSLEAGGILPARLKVLYSGVDAGQGAEDGRDVRRHFSISQEALVLGTVANLFA